MAKNGISRSKKGFCNRHYPANVVLHSPITDPNENYNPERFMAKKLTDWLTICTAGPTVDGRTVQEDDLKDIAETYDPEEYTAIINREHGYGNFGDLAEVRISKDKKNRTILEGRLAPNKLFHWLNKTIEAAVFTSIEITRDFAKTGKSYITGIALTDRPASLGTTKIALSSGLGSEKEYFSAEEPVTLRFSDGAGEQSQGLFTAFHNFIQSFNQKFPNTQLQQTTQKPETTQETDMTELEKKVDSLSSTLGTVVETLSALVPKKLSPEEQIQNLTAENAELKKQVAAFNTNTNPDNADKTPAGGDVEKDQKVDLAAQIAAMGDQIQALSKLVQDQPDGKATQFGSHAGADNSQVFEVY